tara:strand:+ start:416 stop:1198 length:783 start_codon:yes stop_codon:yes gene_type:complete
MGKKSKTCPVGLICFPNKFVLILLLLAIVFLFIYLIYYSKNDDIQDNFTSVKVNNKKKESNNSKNNKEKDESEDDTISINGDKVELNNYKILNYQESDNRQTQGEYLINKDYERIINPLFPPERRNIYLNPSGIERVIPMHGVPINIPTRGNSGGIVQVGVLHKEEISDDTKNIGNNSNPVILPLFGCPTHQGSNKWTYYTSTDGHTQVKLPITNKNRVCNSEYGCDELYDGDNVSIPAYNSNFKVSIYEYDKPRYIPFI